MSLRQFALLTTVTLRVMFFGLMCLGLVLASVFLWMDKISGDNWVAVCAVLFTADRIGSAVSEGFTASSMRSDPHPLPGHPDSGNARPPQ